MSMSLTPLQARLLDYIETYLASSGGIAPSFEEMRLALGAPSKSGVYRLLDALEERGKILRTKNRSRCIRILPENILADIPSAVLIAELTRRSEERRKAA